MDVTRRAELARAVLDNPIVIEAFQTIETDLTNAWANSSVHEAAVRERIYDLLRAARAFKRVFEAALEDGQLHEHQLQAMKRGTI